MKRRDFIKTSVGAGVFLGFPGGLTRLFPQRSQGTMFDKIWDAHVVAHLGGVAYLLQVDRAIGGSPEGLLEMIANGTQPEHPEMFFNVPDHGTSTSPARYTDLSLGSGWQDYEEHGE